MHKSSTRTHSATTKAETAEAASSRLLAAISSGRPVLVLWAAGVSFAALAQLGCSPSRGGAEGLPGGEVSEASSVETRSASDDRERRAAPSALERASSAVVRPALGGARDESDEIRAPVDVEIRRTGRSGRVEVLFSFVAKRDISSATLRFDVPEGIDLIQGATEIEFDGVPAGEHRSASTTLDVPEHGHFELAAGVDVHLAPNVRLHEGAVVELGERRAPELPGRRVEVAGGRDAIRIGPTVPASHSIDVESSSLRVRPESTIDGSAVETDE